MACDRARLWQDDDCRDIAQWIALRDGISAWKAQRLVDAVYALERLPAIADALENGIRSLDKVLELARFATPEDEGELMKWAEGAAPAAIRARADASRRASAEEVRCNRWRELRRWWGSQSPGQCAGFAPTGRPIKSGRRRGGADIEHHDTSASELRLSRAGPCDPTAWPGPWQSH